jgi:hypothetical protein
LWELKLFGFGKICSWICGAQSEGWLANKCLELMCF